MNRHQSQKFFALISLLAPAAITLAQSAPPPCDAPPANATKEVEICFSDACDDFQSAWNACQTSACRQAAQLQYAIDIGSCLLEMTPPPMPSTRSFWITLAYAGGQWSFTFDGSAPPQGVVYQY